MAYSLTLGTVAFLLAVIWGRPLINLLKQYNIGKGIRIEGPSTHQVKTGTPTMGGLMILIPVLVITGVLNIANLLGFNLIGRSILVPMGVMIAFGALGAVDDLVSVRLSHRHQRSPMAGEGTGSARNRLSSPRQLLRQHRRL